MRYNLIKALFLHEISNRCLLLYRGQVFRISVTSIPHLFFLSHSVAVAAWSGIQHVEPRIIYFEAFYNLVRGGYFSTSTPPNNLVLVKAAEKNILHSSKKDNYPSPYPE